MELTNKLLANAQDPHVLLVMVLVAVIGLALLLHRFGRAILLRLSHPIPRLHAVLRSIDRAASFVLPLLFVQMVLRSAPDTLHGIEPLRHLASVLLILALTWLLMRAVRGFAQAVIAQYPLDVSDNLNARRIHTQTDVLMHSTMVLIVLVGLAAVLMTFPSVRTIGASLLASAGVAGLVAGMAARPVLGNLIAGVQIALTQPIRLDDVLIVEDEWGWVEEITGTYVVLRIWDRRRLVIPLQWFIEHPFQNWTRHSADIIGTVFWWVDYRLPLAPLRAEIQRLCQEVPHWWDGELAMLQVTESGQQSIQLRALVTARNSPDCWDLRCHVREGVIDFIQREYPQFLPRLRAEVDTHKEQATPVNPATPG
ncbi:MAG: mechanosensitive ion channel family protein [Formivibrio sp.]|nr:mechanosensitive ion channel family protein [Formivibrio sp.]